MLKDGGPDTGQDRWERVGDNLRVGLDGKGHPRGKKEITRSSDPTKSLRLSET